MVGAVVGARRDYHSSMPLIIDTRELARTAATLEGEFGADELSRLASSLTSDDFRLVWRARGARRAHPEGGADDLLHLSFEGDVTMQCVRCLGDAQVHLEGERHFRLVTSEAQAEREDVDDAEYDVLAGGKRFDLGELVEDEAIMAVPAVVRHEHCELPAGIGAADDGEGREAPEEGGGEGDERILPFAALAALKKREH